MELFRNSISQYSASVYENARNFFKSRDTQRARAEEFKRERDELKRSNEQLQQKNRQLEQELQEARQKLKQAEQRNKELLEQPVRLPEDPPLPYHRYGPRMISLCIELAKTLGLRASERALITIFEWLRIQIVVPTWTCTRAWLRRLGVDRMKHSQERRDDWIWIVDHTCQIGKEKVLVILGIRECHLPPPGESLKHEHVRVLAIVPGTQWKTEDVGKQYKLLAEKIGIPKRVLTDGAVELRDSVLVLEKDGKTPTLWRDLKHFAANRLESMIGNTDAFKGFSSKVGSTRSAVQQTELSHFTPPSSRPKARFMNLGPMLRWGAMVLWHLDHPDSKARQGITLERMEAKLGWLREYREPIAQWCRVEKVISKSLTFINTQGLYRGASVELRGRLDKLFLDTGGHCEQSRQMSEQLVQFVLDAESDLKEGERGLLSSEILESAFGLYKALEGQHSKGGFTSLIAGFASLLGPCTPGEVKEAFDRTLTKNVKSWTTKNLGTTLGSKKNLVYSKTLAKASGG